MPFLRDWVTRWIELWLTCMVPDVFYWNKHIYSDKCKLKLAYNVINVLDMSLVFYCEDSLKKGKFNLFESTGLMYFVFCRLYLPCYPSHHGSVWVPPVISLIWPNTVSPVQYIPISFQIANQNTRRRSKFSKGFHRMGGGQKLLRIFVPLPLIKIFRMRPLLAWSSSLDSTLKSVVSLRAYTVETVVSI